MPRYNVAPAIGIDLGTTNSCVAVFQKGRVEVIANKGDRTTPSCVAFTQYEKIVGQVALDQLEDNPNNTVFDVKRMIGRKFSDEALQQDMKRWPFKVIDVEGKPSIQVVFKNETKLYSPEQISSMVLSKLKETAESYLGQKVTKAVITVPAYFNDAQRQATKDAGKIAGLDVMRIINEPTAAAVAYGLMEERKKQKVLIYDFGGGTFDVSVLTIKNKKIVVKSTGGDTHLGGVDIDNCLVEHFVAKFNQKYDKDMSKDADSMFLLRSSAERAKRTLSSSMITFINPRFKNGINFRCSINQEELNECCKHLFKTTMDIVKNVLRDSKLKKIDVDDVILVGGSSRIPRVQKLLADFFDKKQRLRSINEDEAVARGAAIHAAILNGDQHESLNDLHLQDVTSLSLGLESHGGIFDKFIPRNSTIPITRTKNWTTNENNQSYINIQVYEGERGMIKENHFLGEIIMSDIAPAPLGVPTFEVTFTIDENGILSVSVIDKQNGTKKDIEVKHEKGKLSQKKIEQMINEAHKFKLQDEEEKVRVKALIRLQAHCHQIKGSMIGEPSILREKVTHVCDEMIMWLQENSKAKKESIQQIEKELDSTVNLIMRYT